MDRDTDDPLVQWPERPRKMRPPGWLWAVHCFLRKLGQIRGAYLIIPVLLVPLGMMATAFLFESEYPLLIYVSAYLMAVGGLPITLVILRLLFDPLYRYSLRTLVLFVPVAGTFMGFWHVDSDGWQRVLLYFVFFLALSYCVGSYGRDLRRNRTLMERLLEEERAGKAGGGGAPGGSPPLDTPPGAG